mmetsp:Transcript_23494/g.32950  ORF Transcript_23494/g.32950 Transcript_23494/m.32950 type:complete len:410 (+) Transcript_23494:40-1269(+)
MKMGVERSTLLTGYLLLSTLSSTAWGQSMTLGPLEGSGTIDQNTCSTYSVNVTGAVNTAGVTWKACDADSLSSDDQLVSGTIPIDSLSMRTLEFQLCCDNDLKLRGAEQTSDEDIAEVYVRVTKAGQNYETDPFRQIRCVAAQAPPEPNPSPPGGVGDPHIKKWNGQQYDYHGECDLVLTKNPTFRKILGLHVHIRTQIVNDWSYIESVGIKIGWDILEIGARGVYYLNGVRHADLSNGIAGFKVTHTKPNMHKKMMKHIFEVDLRGGEKLMIKSFKNKNLLHVTIEGAKEESFGDSMGLIGNFKEGKMLARDGKTIVVDPNEFGQEWQVRDTEPMIFREARFPQYPQKCVLPSPVSAEESRNLRRRLGESISLEDAQEACADWGDDIEDCVFDVMATGDLELAEAGSY